MLDKCDDLEGEAFPGRTISTIALALILLSASVIVITNGHVSAAPDGYTDLDDLASQFPSKVIKDGDEYHILGDISLPATQPLYVEPGSIIKLDEGVKLNLSAPALFQGSTDQRISMSALAEGISWGGIFLLERDPTAGSIMKNVTISGAQKSIWSNMGDLHLENVVIENSSRSALEVRGPLGSGNSIDIKDTRIMNAQYYGIHLLKVERTMIQDIEINSSGTGLRAVGSEINIQGSDIVESNSIGISLLDSELTGSDLELISTGGSNTNQIFSINSTIDLDKATASGSATAVSILDGTLLKLSGSEISDCFIDGIYSNDSTIDLDLTTISECTRNGIESYGTDITVQSSNIMNNGPRSGDISYSAVYCENSRIDMLESTMAGSGYSHIEASSSEITIIDSILGSSGSYKLTLDLGTILEMIDMPPLSDIDIKDSGSSVERLIHFSVSVKSFTSGEDIEGATVDVQDYDGDRVMSADTGPDGSTDPELIPISLQTKEGTFTYLPMEIIVQKLGYEVSSATLDEPMGAIQVDLYPPNQPPSLSLIGPVNGTTAEGKVTIEGSIEDDLGIHMIKFRFDSAPYRTIDDLDVGPGGGFTASIDLSGLSSSEHTLFVHAFDGSHLSAAEQRSIYVISSGVNDTDGDGIPDMDEDKNGNGIVDEGETDPNDPDTDDDGLEDGLEIDSSDGNTTDPLNPDSDDDFLRDGDEDLNANGRVDEKETDPNNDDTDGDGVIDSEDIYPLDGTRVDDVQGDEGSMLVLALAVILLILLVIAVYLLYIRSKDGAGNEDQDLDGRDRRSLRTRHRPAPRRDHDRRRTDRSRR